MTFKIVITFPAKTREKGPIHSVLDGLADIRYLSDLKTHQRASVLKSAEVILTRSFAEDEIASYETVHLQKTRMIQLVFAGADKVPFASIPERITVASNAGAFAEPLAEHVLALTLCLAKSILPRHQELAKGNFNQSVYNKGLQGRICGIIGMGGNGAAIARLMKGVGMQVHGVNRSATSSFPLDFIGAAADMDAVLKRSDVVMLTVPLTRQTHNLIGRHELQLMKPDAILINVARGKVVDQQALYSHLRATPSFGAGIDTWWSEPGDPEGFQLDYPFFDLPNLVGSPHNADDVPGAMTAATKMAAKNIRDFLEGKTIRGKVNPTDYAV